MSAGSDEKHIGMAMAVDERHVVTCCHVLNDAMNAMLSGRRDRLDPKEPPKETQFDVRFPFAGNAKVTGRVVVWGLARETPRDVAVLELAESAPTDANVARFTRTLPPLDTPWRCNGWNTAETERAVQGALGPILSNGDLQLNGPTAAIAPQIGGGYSGAGVWSDDLRAFVGMVVAKDQDSFENRLSYAIPTFILEDVWPELLRSGISGGARLTDGIAALPGGAHSRVEQFLSRYLGTAANPSPFGGRETAFLCLDEWLERERQPFALLIEEAGRGKSALLARWAERLLSGGRVDAVLVPVSLRDLTAPLGTTVGILGARLRHFDNDHSVFPESAEKWLTDIHERLRRDRSRTLLIVLDGADEATDWRLGKELVLPSRVGRGIRVLVSVRGERSNAPGWYRQVGWSSDSVLNLSLGPLSKAELVAALRSLGTSRALELADCQHAVDRIYNLTGGDPLVVRLYVDALMDGRIRLDQLGVTQPGIDGFFELWWQEQKDQWKAQGKPGQDHDGTLRAFLAILAVAHGPIRTADLERSCRESRAEDLADAVGHAARLVVGDGKFNGYAFAHPLLRDYWRKRKLHGDVGQWAQRMAEAGARLAEELLEGLDQPSQDSEYFLRFHHAHLVETRASEARLCAILSATWARASERLDPSLHTLRESLRAIEEHLCARSAQVAESFAAVARCRAALLGATLRAVEVPPAAVIVERALALGIITPDQAYLFAQRVPHPHERARALLSMSHRFPSTLRTIAREEAVLTVLAVKSTRERASYSIDLVQRDSTLCSALAAQSLPDPDDEWVFRSFLSAFSPFLVREKVCESLARVPFRRAKRYNVCLENLAEMERLSASLPQVEDADDLLIDNDIRKGVLRQLDSAREHTRLCAEEMVRPLRALAELAQVDGLSEVLELTEGLVKRGESVGKQECMTLQARVRSVLNGLGALSVEQLADAVYSSARTHVGAESDWLELVRSLERSVAAPAREFNAASMGPWPYGWEALEALEAQIGAWQPTTDVADAAVDAAIFMGANARLGPFLERMIRFVSNEKLRALLTRPKIGDVRAVVISALCLAGDDEIIRTRLLKLVRQERHDATRSLMLLRIAHLLQHGAGAAVVDEALLPVSRNEHCPPSDQTRFVIREASQVLARLGHWQRAIDVIETELRPIDGDGVIGAYCNLSGVLPLEGCRNVLRRSAAERVRSSVAQRMCALGDLSGAKETMGDVESDRESAVGWFAISAAGGGDGAKKRAMSSLRQLPGDYTAETIYRLAPLLSPEDALAVISEYSNLMGSKEYAAFALRFAEIGDRSRAIEFAEKVGHRSPRGAANSNESTARDLISLGRVVHLVPQTDEVLDSILTACLSSGQLIRDLLPNILASTKGRGPEAQRRWLLKCLERSAAQSRELLIVALGSLGSFLEDDLRVSGGRRHVATAIIEVAEWIG